MLHRAEPARDQETLQKDRHNPARRPVVAGFGNDTGFRSGHSASAMVRPEGEMSTEQNFPANPRDRQALVHLTQGREWRSVNHEASLQGCAVALESPVQEAQLV